MTTYTNAKGGMLILPNGDTIAPGTSVDLTAEQVKNAGVASWIEDGLLTKGKGETEKEAAK